MKASTDERAARDLRDRLEAVRPLAEAADWMTLGEAVRLLPLEDQPGAIRLARRCGLDPGMPIEWVLEWRTP